MSPAISLFILALWLWFILIMSERRHARQALLLPIFLPVAIWLHYVSIAIDSIRDEWSELFRNIMTLTDGDAACAESF